MADWSLAHGARAHERSSYPVCRRSRRRHKAKAENAPIRAPASAHGRVLVNHRAIARLVILNLESQEFMDGIQSVLVVSTDGDSCAARCLR